MNPDSRDTIHLGINFIVSPPLTIDSESYLGFQKSLIEHGIQFTKSEVEPAIAVIREKPTPLEVKVAAISGSPLGQLLIVAPHAMRDFMLFGMEAESVVEAFESTWPFEKRQVVSTDAAFRDLFDTSREHAFQELWETFLDQSPQKLAALGRPVLGGGLRFVMPPHPNEPEPVQIELKIESFLRDTKKIFIETQFKWPQPLQPGTRLDPVNRLREVNDYIEQSVIPLITGGT
jgi:hypothetical protein